MCENVNCVTQFGTEEVVFIPQSYNNYYMKKKANMCMAHVNDSKMKIFDCN
jgi:hypothetical protein